MAKKIKKKFTYEYRYAMITTEKMFTCTRLPQGSPQRDGG